MGQVGVQIAFATNFAKHKLETQKRSTLYIQKSTLEMKPKAFPEELWTLTAVLPSYSIIEISHQVIRDDTQPGSSVLPPAT
jgi:hypothetical protein